MSYPETSPGPTIKVVDVATTEEVEEFDTYPPPDKDFVYEDPYVTEEEMILITGSDRVKRPRKPASAYFFFVKKNQCRLKLQHPTWAMKKIVKSLALSWANMDDKERDPFKVLAQQDSERYKAEMGSYVQSDSYKKSEKMRKKRVRMKHQIRAKECKDNLEKWAFELFTRDHGGTDEQLKELWNETDDLIKNEYFEQASKQPQTIVTTRSRRQVKLPSRLSESFNLSIRTSKQSSFDNFVKFQSSKNPSATIDMLKSEWSLLTEEERGKFIPVGNSVNYKALDDGDFLSESDS